MSFKGPRRPGNLFKEPSINLMRIPFMDGHSLIVPSGFLKSFVCGQLQIEKGISYSTRDHFRYAPLIKFHFDNGSLCLLFLSLLLSSVIYSCWSENWTLFSPPEFSVGRALVQLAFGMCQNVSLDLPTQKVVSKIVNPKRVLSPSASSLLEQQSQIIVGRPKPKSAAAAYSKIYDPTVNQCLTTGT